MEFDKELLEQSFNNIDNILNQVWDKAGNIDIQIVVSSDGFHYIKLNNINYMFFDGEQLCHMMHAVSLHNPI